MFFMKAKTALLLTWKLTVLIQMVHLVKAQSEVPGYTDQCSNIVCKWGGMCQTDSFGFPVCICPLSCPYSTDVVCSTYGVEFQSACEMHRFACAHVISISLKNRGKCDINVTKSEICHSLGDMTQFRERYMEWIVVVKTKTDNTSVELTKRVHQLSIREKINAIKWRFTTHDHDKNGLLDDEEIKVLLVPMQYEPCGYGFVKSCAMVDGKPGIKLEEWNICFNVAERPYERHR